eukprot:SAG31_NODE_35013_length_327_cov_0.679825_1_plen_26_part_10
MIERPILHEHDDHMVNLVLPRRGRAQ